MNEVANILIEEDFYGESWLVSVRDSDGKIVKDYKNITPIQMIYSFDNYDTAMTNGFKLAKKYGVPREIREPKSRTIQYLRTSYHYAQLIDGQEYLIWPKINNSSTAIYSKSNGWIISTNNIRETPIYFAKIPTGPCT